MTGPDDRAFLDRPVARLLALLVIVLCAALLAYIHRSTAPAGVTREDARSTSDPAAPCRNRRFAEIDAMVNDGVIDQEKAALFKDRADAMCQATSGDGSADPSLPGLLPAE